MGETSMNVVSETVASFEAVGMAWALAYTAFAWVKVAAAAVWALVGMVVLWHVPRLLRESVAWMSRRNRGLEH